MKCPFCGHPLTNYKAGVFNVDVCSGGCGGMWFENLKLENLKKLPAVVVSELLKIEPDRNIVYELKKRYKCPNCVDVVMMRHFFNIKKDFQIDQCPQCGGIWLDGGLLKKVLLSFKDEKQITEAFEEYFMKTFGRQLAQTKMENQAKLASAKKIADFFRFICPTYYKYRRKRPGPM